MVVRLPPKTYYVKDDFMLKTKEIQFAKLLASLRDERVKRLVLGAFSECLGYGGISDLSSVTGISRTTITRGRDEFIQYLSEALTDCSQESYTHALSEDIEKMDIQKPIFSSTRTINSTYDDNKHSESVENEVQSEAKRAIPISSPRIRRNGSGRKNVKEIYPHFSQELNLLLDGNVIGNPESPLCWTNKSLRNLKEALEVKNIFVSHETIASELKKMGFSLQRNKKYTESGNAGPDRDEQFQYINRTAKDFLDREQPVISVDTKKKELIGNFKNAGSEYRRKKNPRIVNDHDFPDKAKGKASPYGVYDIGRNEGFVNVGISSDTGEFAVNSIRTWWNSMGKERYPQATELMIIADCGGSNGRRCRLFRKCLQDFSNESGLIIHVCHFPPGTSKWNKIEHRLFSQISNNWRGRPLESLEVIVSLIGNTRTKEGLKVKCVVDTTVYETGITISDEEYDKLQIVEKMWHGEWNYMVIPIGLSCPT